MSSRLRGWRGPVLLAACATMLSLMVAAGVGEWAVRYRERTRETVPGTMSKLFYQHTRLLHGLERGTDYYGWVTIGRQGFRGARDVAENLEEGVFRIIAVGGSTTFDANTSGDSSAWPARLEQILDSAAGPRKFEVLNAGVPGFQVYDDLARFQFELYRYHPDAIILYQGHNDLFNALARPRAGGTASFDPRPDEIPAVYPWMRWLSRHSLLYHKLRSKWEAVRYQVAGQERGARLTPTDYSAARRQGAEGFARNLRWFLAVAQSQGIQVIVPQVVFAREASGGAGPDSALQVQWARALPFAPPREVWAGYAAFDSVAAATAAKAGATYVPASDPALWLLDGYVSGDPIHFNDAGSWRLARHLATAIQRLPASPSGLTASR